MINLHGVLDLEQEGCTVKEVAVQKAVIIERDQVLPYLLPHFTHFPALHLFPHTPHRNPCPPPLLWYSDKETQKALQKTTSSRIFEFGSRT